MYYLSYDRWPYVQAIKWIVFSFIIIDAQAIEDCEVDVSTVEPIEAFLSRFVFWSDRETNNWAITKITFCIQIGNICDFKPKY